MMGGVTVSDPVRFGVTVIDALMWLFQEKGIDLCSIDENGMWEEAGGCFEAMPDGRKRLRRDIAEAAARMVAGGWQSEDRE